MQQISIHRHVGGDPPDLGTLADLATEEGHPFVFRTLTEWIDGTNRFDLPGEGVFLAAGRLRRVRLRTFDPTADRFYRAIGFEAVDEPKATHSVSL